MRRSPGPIAVLCLSLSLATLATAQTAPVRNTPRAFVSVGDAIGTSSGGNPFGSSIVIQAMRASATLAVTSSWGIEVTALRSQTIFPGGRFNDLEHENPDGDALILSYAMLTKQRGGGIPTVSTIGGGVMRRQTSDPLRTRDMWVARLGFDLDPFYRTRRADALVSFQMMLMPGEPKQDIYVAALGISIRGG